MVISNATGADVHYAFDATASAGSPALPTGQHLVYPKNVTVVHLYTAASQNLNGSAAGNVTVQGEL